MKGKRKRKNRRKFDKPYDAYQAINKQIVKEECPQCDHPETMHFDWRGCHSHWRACTNKFCDFFEKLSRPEGDILELTCSCGKEPIKKSSNVRQIKCANNIPVGAVLS